MSLTVGNSLNPISLPEQEGILTVPEKEVVKNALAVVSEKAQVTYKFLIDYGSLVKWAGVAFNLAFNPVFFAVGFCAKTFYRSKEGQVHQIVKGMSDWCNEKLNRIGAVFQNIYQQIPLNVRLVIEKIGAVISDAFARMNSFFKEKFPLLYTSHEMLTQGSVAHGQWTQLKDGLIGLGLMVGIIFYPFVTGVTSGIMTYDLVEDAFNGLVNRFTSVPTDLPSVEAV